MNSSPRPLHDKVWSKLDRKATAILELTVRQYRKRISTWAVLGVGALIVLVILLFYVEAMSQEIEAFDNDGDSADSDGDGYPDGQENLLGTSTSDPSSNPGNFDPPIPPDSPDKWINEDGFDFTSTTFDKSQGYDDDGDCRTHIGEVGWSSWVDENRNYVTCDYYFSEKGYDNDITVISDPNVDEDPDEDEYFKESLQRTFILAFGKIGFVFILGIFVPLFLASGLIRDEISNGTLHYLVSKPLSRTELLLYRLLGYIALVWPYFIILTLFGAITTGLLGPGDDFFRFQDMMAWFGIAVATCLLSLAYATLFMTLGTIHKYGMVAAIIIGVWEFAMAMLSVFEPEATASRLSLAHWGMVIVDGFGNMAWPDTEYVVALGQSTATMTTTPWGDTQYNDQLRGSDALDGFFHHTYLTGNPLSDALISCFVLLSLTVVLLVIAQAVFKNREID
jgi:ABC-type transport system involved in multi-copper enzyme maturation permease subunit